MSHEPPPHVASQFEELAFLWRHREQTMHAPGASDSDLQTVERRIEGQLQRLLAEAGAYLPFLAAKAVGDDEAEAFTAAHLLLRLDPAGPKLVADALRTAPPDKLAPLRKAICYGPVKSALADDLDTIVAAGATANAAIALEALARHRLGTPTRDQLSLLLESPDPLVRQAGWRVVAAMP